MDTKILNGSPVADKILDNLRIRSSNLKRVGVIPKLLIIRVGDKDNDNSYEKSILKHAKEFGIRVDVERFDKNVSQSEIINEIIRANKNNSVDAIMIFRPLPNHLNEREIASKISPDKDVDGISPLNLGKTFESYEDSFVPCTSKSVIEILESIDFQFEGADVLIVGRSLVVGRPLGMLFLQKDSTVGIAHSKTLNLKNLTKGSDVVVTTLGKPKFFDDSYFNEDSIIIDVGVSLDEDGNLSGDVDFDKVNGKVKAITPVPGGVGALTTAVLLDHVVKACENNRLKRMDEFRLI